MGNPGLKMLCKQRTEMPATSLASVDLPGSGAIRAAGYSWAARVTLSGTDRSPASTFV